MPFVRISPDKVGHLPLFGYDLIADDGEFAWYVGPRGRTCVDKHEPFIWLDDVEDAIQLGADAIVTAPPTPA